MTGIYSRDYVRKAVARAVLYDPAAGLDAAIEAIAQALSLTVDEVAECARELHPA